MNPTSKVRDIISLLIVSQRFKLIKFNEKLNNIHHKIVINYLVPYLTRYTRNVVIAAGLDPDRVPVKNKSISDHLNDSLNPTVTLPDRQDTRGKILALNFIPVWVKESFKDPSRHPVIERTRKKDIENLTATVPVDFFEEPKYSGYSDKLDNQDFDNLKTTIDKTNVEQVLEKFEKHLSSENKPKKKSKKPKIERSKTFGGIFNRVTVK